MQAVEKLETLLRGASRDSGRIVVLTGAGVSAASGIPTFRGAGGYWTVGSDVYRSEELATWRSFRRLPQDVWAWYLYRRGVCNAAAPNAAHAALVHLEEFFGERFVLITQNVDGLHLRAGSSRGRTYEVHGNLNFMRCALECGDGVRPVPPEIGAKSPGESLAAAEGELLRCRRCGDWMRPHVLWFDETYDEPHFRFESSLRAAAEASLLLVAGTSGATTLPIAVARVAAGHGAALVDVNPEPNPFAALAAANPRGVVVQGEAAAVLPVLVSRWAAWAQADQENP